MRRVHRLKCVCVKEGREALLETQVQKEIQDMKDHLVQKDQGENLESVADQEVTVLRAVLVIKVTRGR